MVWEEPPPLIPAAAGPANPGPSATPVPEREPVAKHQQKISARVALVSESRHARKKKGNPSLPPAEVSDPAKALRQAKEEELKLEKEQIENAIKNSTGAVREQWKYRLAVWQEKMTPPKEKEAAAEAAVK